MSIKRSIVPYLLVSIFALVAAKASAETDVNLENGLRLSSTDGQHKFHLGGYLLFDAILQDDNPANPQKFDLFNAWLHIVGTSYKNFHYKVQYSIEDSNSTKLRDAYIAYQFTPDIRLQMGQFVVPTISEYLSPITYIALPGRTVVGGLTPGRDVGMIAMGAFADQNWFYSVGFFNGNGIDANGEDNDSKDFSARLTGKLIGNNSNASGLKIYPDISLTSGKQNGDNINFKAEAGTTLLSSSGLPVEDRFRAAVALYIYYGSSFIKASYLENKYELGSAPDGSVSAWSVLFSHFLTGEQEQYKAGYFKKLKPKKNYSAKNGGGAWQVALQFSHWQADDGLITAAGLTALNEVAANKAKSTSLGLNWILNPNARIGANLIQTKYDRIGATINKDTENKALIRFTLQFF